MAEIRDREPGRPAAVADLDVRRRDRDRAGAAGGGEVLVQSMETSRCFEMPGGCSKLADEIICWSASWSASPDATVEIRYGVFL